MSAGVEYERRRLHGKRYFGQLLEQNPWIETQMRPLLQFNRRQIDVLEQMEAQLVRLLERHPQLKARVAALQTIDGVGPITALTWALETGTPERCGSIKRALSYCGLTSALKESAGQQKRGPLSKRRNRQLQSVLIEAAKLAPMYNEKLRAVHQSNRATLAVARKLAAYLLAADRAFLANLAGTARPERAFFQA
jgi:transposase